MCFWGGFLWLFSVVVFVGVLMSVLCMHLQKIYYYFLAFSGELCCCCFFCVLVCDIVIYLHSHTSKN